MPEGRRRPGRKPGSGPRHDAKDHRPRSGGAPEGVLAAAALRCIGGQMQGRLMFEDDSQIQRARDMGLSDPHRAFTCAEMAKGDVMFAASGVTSGAMLRGALAGSGCSTRRRIGSSFCSGRRPSTA